MITAPDFSLASVSGSPVALADVRPAVLVFASEECPTCAMTLSRLAPAVEPLSRCGVTAAVVFQDPLEVAARVARGVRFPGVVLSEPAPYDVSRAYEVQTLPTIVLVDRDGEVAGRVVGWDFAGVSELLSAAGAPGLPVSDAPPRRKPGCASKSTYDAGTLELVEGGVDELEEMFERGWTDGLPVIPPTRERVDAMLGGRDPGVVLGEIAPAMARVTLERVAACAVLAGCRPSYFPVVVACVEALLDPAFNVGGQAVTTQPASQVVVVNGPVRGAIGLHGGMGALGPGWRANLTIGRAVRLVVALTGGGFPGRLDRSTLGQPGKIGLCFAEDEEASPWEPLHVSRGFRVGDSVATVIACDAPLSISDHRSTSPEELARVLAAAASATWSPNWWPLGGDSLFIICPEHAALFRSFAWSRERVCEEIFDAAHRPARELRWGETTPLVWGAADDARVGKWTSPSEIVLVVAGGEAGRYSAVFGPCLGMNASIVSKEVRWNT